MKIGLDYHGVITAHPVLFSYLTRIFYRLGFEIHIITGSKITADLRQALKDYGILYTYVFSISDYHKEQGTPMVGYETGNPWLDEETWNRTKAQYCKENKIDLHIDDSEIYGQYFETPYEIFNHENMVELIRG